MDALNSQDATQLHEVAIVAMVAVIMGLTLLRLRQPPVVGYILAGIALGPTGLGLISKSAAIGLLAELGVLVLLFLIGMELSVRAFVIVIRPALLIAGGQLTLAFGVTSLFALTLGWSLPQTVLLAFVVAVSSTAVAIKMLEEIGELRTETGRITVGVLIAQDIAIVPMLIITDALGGNGVSQLSLALKIGFAVGFLGWLLWRFGSPGKIRFPGFDLIADKPDILCLAALAFCFSAATLSGFLGLSPAYGAFVAGLVLANSTLRAELISVTHPIQSILLFVFFLSVGLLLDVKYVLNNFLLVFLFVMGVIVLKTLFNITLVRMAGYSLAIAIPAGLSMAQIGEFSFVLAATGFANGAIDYSAYRLAIAVIALSLLISPLWVISVRRFHDVANKRISTMRAALIAAYPNEIKRLAALLSRILELYNYCLIEITKRTGKKAGHLDTEVERPEPQKQLPSPHQQSEKIPAIQSEKGE